MKQRIAVSFLLLFLAAALSGCGSTPPPEETIPLTPATILNKLPEISAPPVPAEILSCS